MLLYAWLLVLATAAEPKDDLVELDTVVGLLELVLEVDEDTAVSCIDKIAHQAQTGELSHQQLQSLRKRLEPTLLPIWQKSSARPLYPAALVLATLWGDTTAASRLRLIAFDRSQPDEVRNRAIDALAAIRDPQFLSSSGQLLATGTASTALTVKLLDALGQYEQPEVADVVLQAYSQFASDVRPKAIGLMIQRPKWSKRLLAAIAQGDIPANVLNVNHLRSLFASNDRELAALAKQQFGSVRLERDPHREKLIAEMRASFSRASGDPLRGQAVFQRVCGQCHRIHNTGQEVGPDITSNGRSSFDQLLSNVFDPSLVIGPGYQAVTVVTSDGRVLTGLVAEDNEQRVVLKTQGGKAEIIPRADIDEVVPSKLSLMPEGLEKQLSAAELADLFSFLVLDRPPQDPSARPIPGSPASFFRR